MFTPFPNPATFVRIERAHRQTRPGDPPPRRERPLRDAAAAHDALRRHLGRHVLEGNVGGHEHDAQRSRRQHHGDLHVTREVRQQLGEAGIPEAREVERVLVHRPSDDRVDLAGESEAHRVLDRLPGDAAGDFREQGAGSSNLRCLGAPCSLLPAPYQHDIRVQRAHGERLRHDFRPDPPRIAEGDGETGAGGHGVRTGRRRTSCGAACRGSA